MNQPSGVLARLRRWTFTLPTHSHPGDPETLPIVLTYGSAGLFRSRERLANHAALIRRAADLGCTLIYDEPTNHISGTLQANEKTIATFCATDPGGW